MEITIRGDVKEIAALVIALQERRVDEMNTKISIDSQDIAKSIHDKLKKSSDGAPITVVSQALRSTIDDTELKERD